MGRKRKHVAFQTIADEDKTSNACPETKVTAMTTTEEKLDNDTNNTNATEAMNVENIVQPSPNGLPPKKKTSCSTNVIVRRSERLKDSLSPTRIPLVNSVVEHVNLVENEEEEAPKSQQVNSLPVVREKNLEQETEVQQDNTMSNVNKRNLEAKLDYLVRSVDEFKTKTVEQVFGRPKEDLSYKSLYINAQKKIEALMEENYELMRKLEFALGKVEAYEKMDTVRAPKEVVFVSNLAKATELTLSLSPQTAQKRAPSTAAAAPGAAVKSKRKKKI